MITIPVIQMDTLFILDRISNKPQNITKTRKIYSNIVEYIYRELPARVELATLCLLSTRYNH